MNSTLAQHALALRARLFRYVLSFNYVLSFALFLKLFAFLSSFLFIQVFKAFPFYFFLLILESL